MPREAFGCAQHKLGIRVEDAAEGSSETIFLMSSVLRLGPGVNLHSNTPTHTHIEVMALRFIDLADGGHETCEHLLWPLLAD